MAQVRWLQYKYGIKGQVVVGSGEMKPTFMNETQRETGRQKNSNGNGNKVA